MNRITVKVSFEPENGTISTGSTEKAVCDIIRAQITDRNFDYGMKIKNDFEPAKRIGLSDVHTKITVTDVVSMTNRIPFITFMRMPKKQEIAIHVEVTSYGMDNFDFFRCISNVTHMNFVGLEDYIESDIIINCDKRNKLDVYFMPESMYLPLILFIPYNYDFPKHKYEKRMKFLEDHNEEVQENDDQPEVVGIDGVVVLYYSYYSGDPGELPDGLFRYNVRHSDDGTKPIAEISSNPITVNNNGCIVSKQNFPMSDDYNYFPYNVTFYGYSVSVKEFLESEENELL